MTASVRFNLFFLSLKLKLITGDYAGMFASVVIVFLPTFILYIFMSEKIIAGITGGGVTARFAMDTFNTFHPATNPNNGSTIIVAGTPMEATNPL